MPTVPRGPFNLFGRWIRAFSRFCQLRTTSALAQQAGVSDNVLSENMREGGPAPTRTTVDRVWTALEEASQESPLRATLPICKGIYYNLVVGSSEQQERAELYLQVLEHFAERENYIQQLEKEVEQLRSKQRRPRT
jgi:hypothetical protein